MGARVHYQVVQIRKAVEQIRAAASCGDDEAAHCLEDQLFRDVLRIIGTRPPVHDGEPSAATLANEALLSRHIVFTRRMA